MITTFGIQAGIKYTEESLSRIYYETGKHLAQYATIMRGLILKSAPGLYISSYPAPLMKEQSDSR